MRRGLFVLCMLYGLSSFGAVSLHNLGQRVTTDPRHIDQTLAAEMGRSVEQLRQALSGRQRKTLDLALELGMIPYFDPGLHKSVMAQAPGYQHMVTVDPAPQPVVHSGNMMSILSHGSEPTESSPTHRPVRDAYYESLIRISGNHYEIKSSGPQENEYRLLDVQGELLGSKTGLWIWKKQKPTLRVVKDWTAGGRMLSSEGDELMAAYW